jgi:hypothetical protein
MKNILTTLILAFSLNNLSAQALSYTDPGAGYMKLMLEKGSEGSYQLVGNFKVKGTSFLFGEKIKGSAYAGNDKSENINLSYNTYNQKLDISLNGSNTNFSKTPSELDSFILNKSGSQYFKEDLLFYSSKIVQPTFKDCFLQVIYHGDRFSFYKAYTSSLDYVSTNYIQSELRQFTLEYVYYYFDAQTKALKKVKLSRKRIADEFSDIMDVSSYLDDELFNSQPEKAMQIMFEALNKKK